ncbi:hypothetical protein [Blastopirellula marina]|uniref:Carboxypeptidase regulatory-like domain-containing protein n=1 Tax=Blastopirellula marina TaxID=124 RepID=A0A2S8FF42_9BACT|nr:hypothetical protein [Blastopirellula marina]PQO30788.1 hypothetical protein C5Y98_20545 [Blastopirellula marina]PTL42641.1 hypothetical protein C5Y97_20555 [Blastopirellula marina]
MQLISNSAVGLAALVLLAVGSGCTPEVKTHPVAGKVLLPTGDPATRGVIEFRTVNEEGEIVNAFGEIRADGSFELTTYEENDGALAGEHEAIVLDPANTDGGPVQRSLFPSRYRAYESSDLKFTIKPGPNDLVVELEGK